MPTFPYRHEAVGGGLVMIVVAGERGGEDGFVDRGFGCEAIKAAAAHQRDLIDQHIPLRAKLAGIARLAQDTAGGIAAAIAELGEAHFNQRETIEVRQQRARVLAAFDADGSGVRLAEEAVERYRGLLMRFVVAVAENVAHSPISVRPELVEGQACECVVCFDKLSTNGLLLPIDRLLERGHAEAAIGVEEAFALVAFAQIEVRRLFDRVDDAVFGEAGAGDRAERHILRARAAERQLVILDALTIDTEDADMAGMVVATGIDAAADLELELAEFALAADVREARRDLLRERYRAGIGEAAIIKARAGDDIADQVEVCFGQAGFAQLLPDRVEIGLADMRQHDVLRVRDAQLVEAVLRAEIGHQVD